MNKLIQMRRGMERLIAFDKDTGTITRAGAVHKIICRAGYQSGGVWPSKQWEGGLTIDASPYVLARHDADLERGDVLEWRRKKYAVGVVTRPEFDGGATCTQAPLTEVD